MATADSGVGTTLTFSASTYAANILSLSWDGISRPVLDTTHLGTTVARTKVPGDLYDSGNLNVTWQFDPSEAIPITSTAETVTLDFPTSGTSDRWTASGFLSDFSVNVDENIMEASGTITFTGAITGI